jgi:subtilase family serine protease
MSSLRFLPLAAAAAVLCLSPNLKAQAVAPAVRVVERVSDSNLVTLKGNIHPAAVTKNDLGRVSADLPMTDLVLVLSRSKEQQTVFDKFVASQYDPKSANYHHWLEPAEVGELYGPAESDVEAVQEWLVGRGFRVDDVSKNRMSIRFSGTAGLVEKAFHTEMHNLNVKGAAHIANMSDPQIPAALSSVVVGVKALHNFFPRPLHVLGPKLKRNGNHWVSSESRIQHNLTIDPKFDSRSSANTESVAKPDFGVTYNGSTYELIAPYDLATMYNIKPLWTSSIDGAGQKIAIAGTSNIDLSDVATFRSKTGLPTNTPTIIATNTLPSKTSASLIDDRLENTLDVEWSGAVAKGASIILVTSSATSASTDTLYLSEQYIVNHKTAPVMSVSYGECELGMGTAGNTEYNTLWQTAASEGIAVFVATGDSGSASCDQGEESSTYDYAAVFGLSVSGLSSTPYNVAVGGTDLDWSSSDWSSSNASNLSNAKGYINEVPWNDGISNSVILASYNDYYNKSYDAEDWANILLYNWEEGNIDTSTYYYLIAPIGGTGGVSACTTNDGSYVSSCSGGYAKPSWQKSVTGISTSDKRTVPDVSFFSGAGALGSAYLICDTLISNGNGGTESASCSYSNSSNALTQSVGGTSAATPVMAGVMALINQKAGSSQGNPNAELYTLAAKQTWASCSSESVITSSSCYFNDIDASNNAVICYKGTTNCTRESTSDTLGVMSGYSATAGYDKATGLGSMNVYNVVKAWPTTTKTPSASLSPTSLAFGSVVKGVQSAAKTVTLSNKGTAALTISSIVISGTNSSLFVKTATTCGSSLSASSTCTISVAFKPASTGSLSATLKVTDNASGSPHSVALTGTGTAAVPIISLSASTLNFPTTVIGSTSVAQAVTITNKGTAAATISSIALGGTNASAFQKLSSCGSSLAVSANCTVWVAFKPTAASTYSATLSITDNASGSPQKVTLSGTGANLPTVTLSPISWSFGTVTKGAISIPKTVTITNSGKTTLLLTSISLTGTGAKSFLQLNNCGVTLAASGSCTAWVAFSPTAAGSVSAKLTITDNGKNSPQTVALSGTGK